MKTHPSLAELSSTRSAQSASELCGLHGNMRQGRDGWAIHWFMPTVRHGVELGCKSYADFKKMKNAALGVCMHSGWGVLVCVSGDAATPEIIDRRRIVVIEPAMEGAKQPYHFVDGLGLEEAERHLQKCEAVSQRLAMQAIHETLDEISSGNHRVVGCAMLLASGRTLPALANILASHALVHTAEGEFFRKVVREACERCRIPVLGFRQRELTERANATFGKAAAGVRRRIAALGKTVGSPWTKDEKTAAVAALMLLSSHGLAAHP